MEDDAVAHEHRLGELGAVLCSCRRVYAMLWERKFYEPSGQQPSEAWADFRMIIMGPGGLWPTDFNTQPRSTAVKLTHQQADFCFALGILLSVPEVRDPATTLVRSTVEYAARTHWVLNPKVEHRARCVRSFLLELTSLHGAISAARDLPPSPELAAHLAKADAELAQRKVRATELFRDVKLPSKVTDWSIEGETLPTLTGAVKAWSEAHDTGVDGVSLYRLLSITSHPQGFSATSGLTFDSTGEGKRVVTIKQVENLARMALAAFYSSLMMVANYHEQRPAGLAAWEDELVRVIPNFFGMA